MVFAIFGWCTVALPRKPKKLSIDPALNEVLRHSG
jgi:hypothetical protein